MTEAEHSELDYRIAIEVFGWITVWHADICLHTYRKPETPEKMQAALDIPSYSTDPAAALEVVEALRQEGWLVTVKAMPEGFPFRAFEDTEIRVRYAVETMWMPLRTVGDMRRGIHSRCVGMADTLALAVCKCAERCIDARREYPVPG